MKHIEVNAETGEVTERDLTAEEIAELQEMANRPTTPAADPNIDENADFLA